MPLIIRYLVDLNLQTWAQVFKNLTSGNLGGVWQQMGIMGKDLYSLCSTFAWVMESEKQAWDNSQGAMGNFANQIGGAFAETRIAVDHVVFTIIPKSVSYGVGHAFSQGIGPLRARVHQLQGQINVHDKDIRGLINNNNKYLFPLVSKWNKFIAGDWKRAQGLLGVLQDWLARPGDFADFATPAIAGPLATYLNDPANQDLLDRLVGILIDASPDRFRHVESAALAVLESPYP